MWLVVPPLGKTQGEPGRSHRAWPRPQGVAVWPLDVPPVGLAAPILSSLPSWSCHLGLTTCPRYKAVLLTIPKHPPHPTSLTHGCYVDDVPISQVEGPVLVRWPEDLNQVPGLRISRVGGTEALVCCHLVKSSSGHSSLAGQPRARHGGSSRVHRGCLLGAGMSGGH